MMMILLFVTSSCVVWMEGHLMLGGESGDLHVWEADTFREIDRYKAHSGSTLLLGQWFIISQFRTFIDMHG